MSIWEWFDRNLESLAIIHKQNAAIGLGNILKVWFRISTILEYLFTIKKSQSNTNRKVFLHLKTSFANTKTNKENAHTKLKTMRAKRLRIVVKIDCSTGVFAFFGFWFSKFCLSSTFSSALKCLNFNCITHRTTTSAIHANLRIISNWELFIEQ